MRLSLRSIKPYHVFIFLVLLGSFLRLYRLRSTLQFLGDQGRDVLIVRRMLIERHPALIGPVTSVGNMYLGPLYYYFMLFPLLLTYPDPTGPALAVALMGIATLALIYVLGKKMVGERAALFATAAYAVSPLIITYSRFSWNPNIVPFFSLLFIWHLYQALKGQNRAWVFVGLWFSLLIQLHYITLIVGAFAGIGWIWTLVRAVREGSIRKDFFVYTALAIIVFLISLIPLAVFDIRHGYINSRAFTAFFQSDGEHFRFFSALPGVVVSTGTLFVRNIAGMFLVNITGMWKLLTLLTSLGIMGQLLLSKKKREYRFGEQLLFTFFLFSCGFLALYRSSLYDHYLSFLFPIGALMFGMMLSALWDRTITRPLVALCVGAVILVSLQKTPGKENLGYNIDMMNMTAMRIQEHVVPGEKYNIFLFSPTRDYQGMNYRYFLTTGKQAPEREDEFFNFTTLFVIDDERNADIEHSNHYQLVVWPNRKVVETFEIPGGARVSVLRR